MENEIEPGALKAVYRVIKKGQADSEESDANDSRK